MGTDYDTFAFAVATIRTWWQRVGATAYPHARRLLITADGGGSNGYRTRIWKVERAKLATETGLEITCTLNWLAARDRRFGLAWRTSSSVTSMVIARASSRSWTCSHAPG